ncbi:MAG: queuosine precursor transporter [Patescibacteria group bacterium]|nr:queuosine precursor transporter [Patescibacteria group bacterium]
MHIPLVSASLYVAFQLIANVLSTKITILPVLHLAIDAGTIIYPFTFTLRDFVHKTWGKNNSRQVVVLAALLNLLMFALSWLVGRLPADASWPYQEAYEQILLPVGRIVAASVIAQVISELIDTEVFSAVYKKFSDVFGVVVSNFAGLVVDSLLFSTIAFWGVLPATAVGQIIISNILLKLVITFVSAPIIKLVPRTAREEEI